MVHVTSIVDVLVTVTVQPVDKRIVSADILAYASPCSGLARFSSACSYIDVTAKTFTAATPSTTVTLPVTNTIFISITVPIETDSATVEDATVTQATTVTTVTNQVVTTVTATPQQSVATRMQFSLDGQTHYIALANIDGSEPDPDGGYPYTKATTIADDAIEVTLDSTGKLLFRNKVARRIVPSSIPITSNFVDETNSNELIYICSKDTNNFLSCSLAEDWTFALRSLQSEKSLLDRGRRWRTSITWPLT